MKRLVLSMVKVGVNAITKKSTLSASLQLEEVMQYTTLLLKVVDVENTISIIRLVGKHVMGSREYH